MLEDFSSNSKGKRTYAYTILFLELKTLNVLKKIKLDEEIALKLQSEIDEEERLTREKDEANVALTKMDDYSMLKFDVDTSWLKDCKLKNNKATKIKELMKIIPDEREVAIDAIPLATKPPTIVD
ncbi:hypothetical protein Tco_1316686 [Tanacetum coccineum]